MPLTDSNGNIATNVQVGGTLANTVTLNGTVVWTRVVSRGFTITDAGIAFAVSESGVVSLSINIGALEGTNYTNGQNIGTVTTDTTRILTGVVRVPNDATLWTNAGQTVSITGVTAVQDAVDATAAWTNTAQGMVTGGVEQPESCGMYGNWTGAPGVTDIVFGTDGLPDSATCGESDEFCTVMRTRTCTTNFTGATRTDTYTCQLTMAGEGTPTCAAVSSLGLPLGNLSDTDTHTVTGLTRTESRLDTESRQVTNDAYTPALSEFALSDLQITAGNTLIPSNGLALNANAAPYIGVGAHSDSVTSVTCTAAISANTLTNTRTVTLNFTIQGNVPEGFLMEGGSTYSFDASVQTMQQAQVIQDATAADVSPTDHAEADGYTVGDTGTVDVINVVPTQGRWNASASGNVFRITSQTGTGAGSFGWRFNGPNFIDDVEVQVRSGHTIGEGILLATFTLTL